MTSYQWHSTKSSNLAFFNSKNEIMERLHQVNCIGIKLL